MMVLPLLAPPAPAMPDQTSPTTTTHHTHAHPAQLIGGSIFLFRINRNLAFVTVFGIFLIGALTTLHGEFIRRMGRRSQVGALYYAWLGVAVFVDG